jgi:hypothetical protein
VWQSVCGRTMTSASLRRSRHVRGFEPDRKLGLLVDGVSRASETNTDRRAVRDAGRLGMASQSYGQTVTRTKSAAREMRELEVFVEIRAAHRGSLSLGSRQTNAGMMHAGEDAHKLLKLLK